MGLRKRKENLNNFMQTMIVLLVLFSVIKYISFDFGKFECILRPFIPKF